MLYKKLFSAKVFSASLLISLLFTMPSPALIVFAQEAAAQETQSAPSTDGESGAPTENGTSGTGGLNGGEEAPPAEGSGTAGDGSGTTVVATGDALSTTDANNTTNTNTVDTSGATSTGTSGGSTWYQKWRDEMCKRYPVGHEKRPRDCPVVQVTVSTDNTANIDAQSTTTAATGENTAEGGQGTAIVDTGNALAFGNAINVANSNIINSSGMLLFLNLLFGEGYDMRNMNLDYFFGGGGTQGGCSLTGCGTDLTVNADNEAVVTNSLVVRAVSGANSAVGDAGALVNTGNAYAAGNAVNLVNTNIIDSNYLLVTLNSFGDLGNDIILPGADFFSRLLAMQGDGVSNTSVNANNTANLTDSTAAGADSGANTSTTGEGNAVVNSGNAISSATAFNQVNTNLIGGTQIFLLFRVWGDWSGSIQGLPEGMMWEETPFGIVLKNEDGTPASTGALKGACTISCEEGSLAVNATNTATVGNNVNVFALSGDNKAESASGTALVNTGDAFAAANSVNMVNTNLIGQNWIFMIFNIFGNWDGNIAFGKPDLWVGASAETGNPTIPGSEVTYHFTVSNRGDSDATNVRLYTKHAKDLLRFSGAQMTDDGVMWPLGTIPRGTTKEFVYKAIAGAVPDGVSAAVPLEATVTSAEVDNNAKDNVEKLDLVIMNPNNSIVSRGVTNGGYEPKIVMTKTANAQATSTPAMVDYTIVVKNEGGDAYNVYLKDVLRGPMGNFIGNQEWDLGKVKSGEEVKITYTVRFGKSIPVGWYKNTATLHGMKNLTIAMDDVSVTNMVEIIPAGEVLAATTQAAMCSPYLLEFIKPGARNSAFEVKKLQNFLVKSEGASVTESGQFDSNTISAVKSFQSKYAGEILTPWGITQPTGSVYHTTKKKINELTCDGVGTFNLTNEQIEEINSFKAATPPAKADSVSKGKVGVKPSVKKNALAPAVPAQAVNFGGGTETAGEAQPASTTGLLKKQLKNLSSWLISAKI